MKVDFHPLFEFFCLLLVLNSTSLYVLQFSFSVCPALCRCCCCSRHHYQWWKYNYPIAASAFRLSNLKISIRTPGPPLPPPSSSSSSEAVGAVAESSETRKNMFEMKRTTQKAAKKKRKKRRKTSNWIPLGYRRWLMAACSYGAPGTHTHHIHFVHNKKEEENQSFILFKLIFT